MKIKEFAYLVLIAILIILLLQRECGYMRVKRNYQIMHDSLTTRIDKDGFRIKSMRVLDGNRKNTIKALQSSNDSLNNSLADLIKKAGRKATGATIINTTTEVMVHDTTTIIMTDTIIVVGTDTFFANPVYAAIFKDEWIEMEVIASKDSITSDFQFKNKIEIIEKRKWNRTELEIKNLNPYTDTESMRSWTVKRMPRRWGVGIHAGYGVGSDLQLRPHVGVGVQWSVISF